MKSLFAFIIFTIILNSQYLHAAGWQGFQKSNFNQEHWSFKPNPDYVRILNAAVKTSDVDFRAPYQSFHFDRQTACYDSWEEAWQRITPDSCKVGSIGNVSRQCYRDLFLVLPCENRILSMNEAEIKSTALGIEAFIGMRAKRRSYIARNDDYVVLAYQKAIRIYAAYQEREAKVSESLYKQKVGTQLGVQSQGDSQQLNSRQDLLAAYKNFSRIFDQSIKNNDRLIKGYNEARSKQIGTENRELKKMQQQLNSALNEKKLNWDIFNKNHNALLDATENLDTYLVRWLDLHRKLDSYKQELESLLEDFRTSYSDIFWAGSDDYLEQSSILGPQLNYINAISERIESSRKREAAIRSFRSNYLKMYHEHLEAYIDRIAKSKREEYLSEVDLIYRSKKFHDKLIPITSVVHNKLPTGEHVSFPYLKQRYLDLINVINHKYICEGQIEEWKKMACDIATRHFRMAQNEVDGLIKSNLESRARIMFVRARRLEIDIDVLVKRIENISADNIAETLDIYDGFLKQIDEASKPN